MDVYTVSFFGHRRIYDSCNVEKELMRLLRKLLSESEYVEFLVGRNGDFDILVSSAVRRVKSTCRDDNCALILVLPYPTAEFENNRDSFLDYYDEVEICERSALSHYKGAIKIRNREMIDRSDLAVFYLEHTRGGAYEAYRYAKDLGKPTVNLHNNVIDE